uniref:Uncharacterized protein n=1 Tax=Arundo donax TaxID=35708 RepID=A0A0A9AK12_ARUDO
MHAKQPQLGYLIIDEVFLVCLQGGELFTGEGYPKMAFPDGWKGASGLYSVGFTRRGLSGVSLDAVRVAQDIAASWNSLPQCR